MSAKSSRPNLRRVLLFVLLALAVSQFAGAALIQAKALLAPVLIDRAWQNTLNEGGGTHRPWPWADTWPVARLRVPEQRVDLPVLHGDSGNALAFAPGMALGSAAFERAGTTVIGGHRDTHFTFLQHVDEGDEVQIQLADGRWRAYRISALRIVDASVEFLPPPFGEEKLMLVTCYPFNTIRPGGPLRYVVVAEPLNAVVAKGAVKVAVR